MIRLLSGITAKFTALATLLVVCSTVVWGAWVWRRERALIRDHMIQEGRILVSTMAIPILNTLLYEEVGVIEEGGLLDNFIGEIMAQEGVGPLYAMVLDPAGRVLAHNVLSEYGEAYSDPLSRRALSARAFLLQETSFHGQPAWDLTHPLAIHGKRWGVLRVGVSLHALEAKLRELGVQLAFFAGSFIVGGFALFYLMGRGLAGPLRALVGRMEAVGTELPEPPPPSLRRDEIGALERSFSAMLTRLRRSETHGETALRRLLENERLVAAGQIVAGVAHEVNNPLAAIESALFQVERKEDPDSSRYLGVIRQGMERIRNVVAQLLDLSRSGDVRLASVDLGKLFADAVLFAKMALKRKGVRLEILGVPPEGSAILDAPKIQQALLNLFVNAADAVGEGGIIRFFCRREGEALVFAVEDDGPGIPPELRERVFEPFFTTKPPGQGSGMGLAISRRIAEVHGGSLRIEDAPDGGVRFALRLPLGGSEEGNA